MGIVELRVSQESKLWRAFAHHCKVRSRKLKEINSAISKELKDLKDKGASLSGVVIQPAADVISKPHEKKDGSGADLVSWTNAVRGSSDGSSKTTIIKQVTKAVHSDLISKKHRETNIVVSGMKPGKDTSDTKLFENLISTNLKLEVKPTLCKRIGVPKQDKIQPLLVVLSSAGLADSIISRAKMLRNSESVYTRQHVYINRFLTKSEAEAQFEIETKASS